MQNAIQYPGYATHYKTKAASILMLSAYPREDREVAGPTCLQE